MRGTVAKRLRRQAFGDKADIRKYYVFEEGHNPNRHFIVKLWDKFTGKEKRISGSLRLEPTCPRRIYQLLKRAYCLGLR
jgi:hypothetical protein